MPRHKYKTREARRRHTSPFALAEPEVYDVLMTNADGTRVKTIKVRGTSGVNAWYNAIIEGDGEWHPVEITRGNEWKYTAF